MRRPLHRGAGQAAPRARQVWVRHVEQLSWLLLAAGLAAAAVFGMAWRNSVQSQNTQDAAVRSDAIEARLAQAIGHDGDLASSVGALTVQDPGITNTQFGRWFDQAGGNQQYSNVVAMAYTAEVPAAGLHAATVRADSDPPFGLPADQFTLNPPTPSAQYCFLQLGLVQVPKNLQIHDAAVLRSLASFASFLDPGYNECQGPSAALLLTSAASGGPVAGPLSRILSLIGPRQVQAGQAVHALFGSLTPFFELQPVYRTATIPTTTAARLQDVSGWVIVVVDAGPLLAPVVAGQQGLAVALSYQNPTGTPVLLAHAGQAAGLVVRRTVAMGSGGRWIAQLSVPVDSDLTPNEQGAIVAFGIVVLTMLLFALVRVLAVARGQALELVAQTAGELEHQARHDSLTGLANRSQVLEDLDQALARGRAGHANALALLVIDLDGFKDINDAFGHGIGDELLQAVAERLVEMVGVSNTVGRIGGDEFVVIVDGGPTDDPEQLARSIVGALSLPIRLPSVPGTISMGASVGVAMGLRASARDLLRDADIALYEAKSEGKNRHAVFRPEMRVAVVNRFDLESELRTAMRANQFFLVYQPTFDLEGMGVTGVEALLRWHHPTRGIVPPVEFVPVLESSGMIVEVGRWVLAEACRQVRLWHNEGYKVSVAVNVSGRQFEGSNLVADVRGALVRSGLDSHSLVIEITETVLMRDPQAIADRLHEVKALGVRVAIDDFGTGYSSMAYLQQFPVDILKIDRSFVMGMVESPEGAALVRALVQLGKALGLVTLAEGIEDELQLYRLRAEHCDAGQGYLFAKPLSAIDAVSFMAERSAKAVSGLPPSGAKAVGAVAANGSGVMPSAAGVNGNGVMPSAAGVNGHGVVPSAAGVNGHGNGHGNGNGNGVNGSGGAARPPVGGRAGAGPPGGSVPSDDAHRMGA